MPPTWGAPWPNPPPLMGAPGMRRAAECVQGRVSGCAITAKGWCPYASTSGSQPRALHAMGATLEHMSCSPEPLVAGMRQRGPDATIFVLLSSMCLSGAFHYGLFGHTGLAEAQRETLNRF